MDLKETNNLTVPLADFHKASITRGFEVDNLQKAEGDKQYQGLIFYYQGKVLFLLGNEDAEWGAGKYQIPGGEVFKGEDENRKIIESVYEDIHIDVSQGIMRGIKIDNCQYYFYMDFNNDEPIISLNDSTHKNYLFLSTVAIQAMPEDKFVEGLKTQLLKVLGLSDPKEK